MNTKNRRWLIAGIASALSLFTVTSLLAQSATTVVTKKMRHASTEHYAAIWSKHSTGPWVARHGMSDEAYQREFDKLTGEGFRLVSVDGYEVNGQARYAAIWRKASGPAWIARHGLSSADYQAAFDKNGADGYRLISVNGYTVNGHARFAAIWEKSGGPAWVARHGLSSTQYQAAFDSYVKDGYRLELVSGYAEGNEARYAAIWRKGATTAWAARHGLSSDDYQSAFNSYSAQGYRLTHVSGYTVAGQTRYAAIWDKSNSGEWVARHGMSASTYQEEFDALTKRGFSLDVVSGY